MTLTHSLGLALASRCGDGPCILLTPGYSTFASGNAHLLNDNTGIERPCGGGGVGRIPWGGLN